MKKIFYGLTVCSVLCAGALCVAAPPDENRDAESVERLQRIEIQKFYRNLSGKAPMLPMAISFYNDAVKFFEKNEYELAKQAAQESLSLESRNPLALELLGEIANLQQDHHDAEEYFKKSFSLNPSPRLRKKIEKLQQERVIEKDLGTYGEEHFIIKYRKGDEGYEGSELQQLLREGYRQISQDMGYYFNHKIVVLFYDRDQFHDATGQSGWVGGLYDGKIRLPSYQGNEINIDLRAALIHEMTHAFVAAMSGMRAPAWLHEGLAQYEENKIRPIDLRVFNVTAKKGALIPLEQLFSVKAPAEAEDPLEAVRFYQQSFKFVDYLIGRYQMYRVKTLLEKFKEGKNAEEALAEVLGRTPKHLEAEWLDTLSGS
ncbi:MAG: hypothetical protein KTQ49_01335 [Candidatus Omnitrophica bacterium]|nr:hypothetical protein [Candidatus Omnitrophota bacterium]